MSADSTTPVRVRFAPSPTGYLHVGGARTAIYNWLFRRKLGGALILRIEDTDRARSDDAMTRQIQDALRWLGVTWDEGPFLQTENFERHVARAHELVESGHAYACFCSSQMLESQRAEAEKKGQGFLYPRTCFELERGEVEGRIASGEPHIIRFLMPRENTRFIDLLRGEVDVPPDALDDFILVRSDGSPTYHLSVVSDDIDMGITHVVRGDDHLSNTPKHIRLFEALGAPVPVFAHLPLVLGEDKKKLSKSTGAMSVEEFREQGILPQALFNYLALLSWTPQGGRGAAEQGADGAAVPDREAVGVGVGVRHHQAAVVQRALHLDAADAGADPLSAPVPRSHRGSRRRRGAARARGGDPSHATAHAGRAGGAGQAVLRRRRCSTTTGSPRNSPGRAICRHSSARSRASSRRRSPGTRTRSRRRCVSWRRRRASRPARSSIPCAWR